MVSNVFDEIMERVSLERVFEFYGFPVDNRGFAKCPFHDDSHPSMKVGGNNKPKYSKCFVCHWYGNSLNFVSKLYNISILDAAKKLNADFRLDLKVGEALTKEETRKIEEKHIELAKKSFATDKTNFMVEILYDKMLSLDYLNEQVIKLATENKNLELFWTGICQKMKTKEKIINLTKYFAYRDYIFNDKINILDVLDEIPKKEYMPIILNLLKNEMSMFSVFPMVKVKSLSIAKMPINGFVKTVNGYEKIIKMPGQSKRPVAHVLIRKGDMYVNTYSFENLDKEKIASEIQSQVNYLIRACEIKIK